MTARTKKLKILGPVPGFAIGQVVDVDVDDHGTPTSKFWRDRVQDSLTDNCLAVVVESKKQKPVTEEKK